MTGFLIGAIALTALTLAFLLPPLWTQARGMAVGLLLLVPASTVGLYYAYGTPQVFGDIPEPEQISLDEAIDRLQMHLTTSPDELEGWVLLGRSRKAQERFAEARDAFAQAHRLLPDEPDLLVEYAEAITLASDSRLIQGQALALLEQALAINPAQQRALWFIGIHHYQQQRWTEATEVWERLLPIVGEDTRRVLVQQIGEARERAGLPPLDLARVQAPAEDAAAPGILAVRVELDPALAGRVQPGDTLFVFARQPEGPAMPLAVRRVPAGELPLTLTLSDADSPMPALPLSAQERVRLVARISRSGDAAARPGDLAAEPLDIDLPASGTQRLVIDRVVD